ncbi:hypothetical protein Moror_14989 [Moniliophthora roreri MCA 2997]|uniref:Uncharacterized protein n=1 Tax=Moniliophthora roreri (strain MCA 2997) TaxID=1381753 RepID=V2WNN2_MONRO|nr:hypothetical protein Moror_14989 [Moniliophthora roreri MCA 2997]
MEPSTSSETPTLPIIAAESLGKAATSPEHTRTKINAHSPIQQRRNPPANSPVTVLTPILTSTLPSPRIPASSRTPDKIRPAGLAL